MKKSSFTALLLGTLSGVLFAIGMCMALIAEWNAFTPGVVLGCAGVVLGIATMLIWRKMEHKAPCHLSGRHVRAVLLGVAGAMLLGVGMCFCMVWQRMLPGMLIGVVGIVLLVCLIPLLKGVKGGQPC
ncbi:MAG: hypothetical protein KHX17_03240 [Clostridiales bacterium]|nr:hypothetical protein [Clostridiales bacterium]